MGQLNRENKRGGKGRSGSLERSEGSGQRAGLKGSGSNVGCVGLQLLIQGD